MLGRDIPAKSGLKKANALSLNGEEPDIGSLGLFAKQLL
jgi:hypothetical protein